jgi:hypothetical protein
MLKLEYLPKWQDATGDSILMIMCEQCGERIEKLEDGLVLCRLSKNGNPEHHVPSDLLDGNVHIVHSSSQCDMQFTLTHSVDDGGDWVGLALAKIWPFTSFTSFRSPPEIL